MLFVSYSRRELASGEWELWSETLTESGWKHWVRAGLAVLQQLALLFVKGFMTALRGLGLWAGRLAFVLLCLAPIGVIVALTWDPTWGVPARYAVVALWLSLTALGAAISWGFLWLVARAAARLVQLPAFGPSLVPRLAAGAAVFAFLPDVGRAAVTGSFWAVTQLGVVMPISVARAAEGLDDFSSLADGTDLTLFLRVSGRFLQYEGMKFDTFGANLLERVPLANLVVAFCAWLVISISVRGVLETGVHRRIVLYLKGKPSFNPSNIGFVSILVISAFLSFAAIISLPRLREDIRPNKDVDSQALEQVLRNQLMTKEQVANLFSEDLSRNPLEFAKTLTPNSETPKLVSVKENQDEVEEATEVAREELTPQISGTETATAAPIIGDVNDASSRSEGGESAAASPSLGRESKISSSEEFDEIAERARYQAELRSAAEQQLRLFSSRYRDLAKNGADLGVALVAHQSRTLRSTVQEYKLRNLDRQGSREEIKHFLVIQTWFAQRVAEDEGALRWCSTMIRQNQQQLDRWSGTAFRLERSAGSPSSDFEKLYLDYTTTTDVINRNLYDASRACVARDFGSVPEPPPLGASLGPLQFIAGWLLDAGSLPLALIVGMMGFGLFGAVISTFVRERRDAVASPDVVVSDLAGVVLRGLSAAIVVFLAVQGGLAVLSGAGSDPNPYVLLLACFVAAVFSERVWSSAQQYLVSKLASPTGREPEEQQDQQTHEEPGA